MDGFFLATMALWMCAGAGGLAGSPESGTVDASRVKGIPLREVAPPLREAWLRFHEGDLCLDIDGVFVFQPRGVEIWCRTKDERGYRQLAALMEPLRRSFQVEIYATRADREKKTGQPQDDEPPPSLWTNGELRLFLRDPFYDSRVGTQYDPAEVSDGPGPAPEMKRRMKLFSDQILEWEAKMVRLASDLPVLADAGYGESPLPDIRSRAREVCLGHAREVRKCVDSLVENLTHALPRGTKTGSAAMAAAPARIFADTPVRGAPVLARQAQEAGVRIIRFLYPQAHTVTLTDLREPSLIDILKAYQQTVSDFETSARKAR